MTEFAMVQNVYMFMNFNAKMGEVKTSFLCG